MKPTLAVSLGDPAGIGPEVVVAAAAVSAVRRACRIAVFGDAELVRRARVALKTSEGDPSAITTVREVGRLRLGRGWPQPSARCGAAAFAYLDAAARAVSEGEFDALVTAPINKLWLHRAGHHYDGHTGYLAELTDRRAVMMLAGRRLRVVLVTTHVALSEVSSLLSAADIVAVTRVAEAHLRSLHGVARPRLAMAALNPHAGEGGLFGDEEKRVLAPAVQRLTRAGISIEGPLAADTLFAAAASGDYDAVICMYHDQALIPLKLLEFGRSVNISMGLPFIRTSPDHGTAYELAGRGTADAGSMTEALLCAARMVRASR